jgi:monoamine oxidase
VRSLGGHLGIGPRAMRDLVVACWTHDWTHDPFARGAYSYALVGGADASPALGAPVEDTLYAAGEASDPDGATGTVSGAINAGRKAADACLAAG